MRSCLSLCILGALLLSIVVCKQEPTIITFVAEYEDEQNEEFIALSLLVKADDTSLVRAMSEASSNAKEIEQIANDFCKAHSKKKSECKGIVDIGNHAINPKYQQVRKESKFMGFEVQHEVTVNIRAVDHISDLADLFLEKSHIKIIKFEWKSFEESNPEEEAVKQGMEQGEELCYEIGMHLDNVQSVEEVTEKEDSSAIYKFGIQCLPGVKESQIEDEKEEEKPQDKKAKSDEEPKKEKKPKKQKKQKKEKKSKKKGQGAEASENKQQEL